MLGLKAIYLFLIIKREREREMTDEREKGG